MGLLRIEFSLRTRMPTGPILIVVRLCYRTDRHRRQSLVTKMPKFLLPFQWRSVGGKYSNTIKSCCYTYLRLLSQKPSYECTMGWITNWRMLLHMHRAVWHTLHAFTLFRRRTLLPKVPVPWVRDDRHDDDVIWPRDIIGTVTIRLLLATYPSAHNREQPSISLSFRDI